MKNNSLYEYLNNTFIIALYISQSDLYSGSISQNTDASDFITFSQSNLKQEEIIDDGISVSCNGDNKICVDKDLCIDGYVNFVQKELIRDKQQVINLYFLY